MYAVRMRFFTASPPGPIASVIPPEQVQPHLMTYLVNEVQEIRSDSIVHE